VSRRFLAVTAALVALVVAAPAAASGTSLEIAKVDTTDFPSVHVTVRTDGAGATPDIQLLENGAPANNAVMADPGAPAAIALLIDQSQSMTGDKLPDAINAAKSFVAAQKPTTPVGLYGFGDQVYTAAPISTDRTQVDTALDQLALAQNPGTALYDAVKQASQALAATPAQQRVIVLLTDGASDHDSATLDQAVTAAQTAGVDVYPIGIATDGAATAALQQIAKDTGGTFNSASDSAALPDIYNAINDQLGSTYVVTYHSLAPEGSNIEIKATADGFTSASTSVKAPGTYVAPSADNGRKMPTGTGARLGLGLLAALLVLLASLVLLKAKPSVVIGKRIKPFTENKKSAAQEAVASDPTRLGVLQQLFVATEKIIGSMNWWQRTSTSLEQADLPLRTAELFYIQIGTGLVLGAFVALVLGHPGIIALVALLIGFFIPVFFVRFKAKQRLNRFEHQLPETLITMAASLKAGHAFNQAIQSAVNEGADPTAKEFSRVLAETQLGMQSELALEAMANRMNSYNFGFVVMSVNIQRTVGGSLADILDMVADTVRQRQQFEKKVKALTAQGRMSAYVLLAMPFLMALAIFAINPKYMQILWTDSLGRLMIAIGLVSMAFGAMIIRKIVAFKG
jgi:tight adherence protein B